jgi:catechol 2,3-dioxygenase-like lactoylglutathione lyase family enzyme
MRMMQRQLDTGLQGNPPPSRESRAEEAGDDFPLGWVIIWLLLALTLFASPTKAQALPQRDARAASTGSRVSYPPPPVASAAAVERVEVVGMTVSDMDRAVEFYTKVLTFEKVSDVEVTGEDYEHLEGVFGLRMRVVRLKLGDEMIELTEYLAPQGRPIPQDSRSNDHWFQHIAIITSDMERAYVWLRQNRVRHASSGPQRLPDWNKNAGGIKAFYFKDPDGHTLEVLQFPEGKGDRRWHRASGGLFLGIDHTAIVVGDTEESLKFYRDVLGLSVVGESENYGPEQEHLNNVFGARLRITSLRAGGGGPGIEFLQYLAPRDGRPVPEDERANDLGHWQTRLVVSSAKRAAQTLLDRKFTFVSSGVVEAAGLGFTRGFLVRDPDGHVMQLVEK